MQHRIVTLPSAKIREVARVALEGYWKQIVLFMFLYYLITTGVSNILDMFFYTHSQIPFGDTGEMIDEYLYYGSSIYIAVINGPITWAMSKFLLEFFRYQKVEFSTLLEGFSCLAKTLVLTLLMGIKIFLWSMLFIIPGILAAFRYSQAFYVMIDHPEYSANQCLAESSRIMAGNKMKYFTLNLSYIGWNLLAGLPAVCFATMLTEATGIKFVLLDLVFSIPLFFLNAYLNMGMTVFYELITDNLTIVDAQEEPADHSPYDVSIYSAPEPEETLVNELPKYELPEETAADNAENTADENKTEE